MGSGYHRPHLNPMLAYYFTLLGSKYSLSPALFIASGGVEKQLLLLLQLLNAIHDLGFAWEFRGGVELKCKFPF